MTCATGFCNAIRVLILPREPSPLPVAEPTGFTTVALIDADPGNMNLESPLTQYRPNVFVRLAPMPHFGVCLADSTGPKPLVAPNCCFPSRAGRGAGQSFTCSTVMGSSVRLLSPSSPPCRNASRQLVSVTAYFRFVASSSASRFSSIAEALLATDMLGSLTRHLVPEHRG